MKTLFKAVAATVLFFALLMLAITAATSGPSKEKKIVSVKASPVAGVASR
jgi:hypothetical protein